MPVPVPVVPPPTGTRAPVEPPKPVGVDLWRQNCSTNSFRQCLSRNRAQEGICARCLYAFGLLNSQSTSGVTSCGKNMCGGCVEEAMAFYMCGMGKSEPTPPTVAPVPVTEDPVVAPSAPTPAPVKVDTEYTSLDCPAAKPSPGDSCVVPSGFTYQRCGYPTGMNNMEDRCLCAYGSFMCNLFPISPTAAPVPMPVAPTPPGTTDPGICAASLPKSGDTCSTGGMDFAKCCYSVPNTAANYVYVCSCLNNENKYLCYRGTTTECDSIIKPTENGPVTLPEMPDSVPASVPVTMPEVPDSVPAPAAVPVIVPVTAQVDCPPQDTPPNTGDDCASLFSIAPTLTSVTCRYWQSYTDSSNVANTSESLCTCSSATKTFTCDGKIAPVPESISNGPELITATGPGTGTGIMSTGPDNMGTTTIVSTDSTDTTTTTSTSMDSEGNMASSISIDTNTDMTTGLGSMDPAGPAHSDGGGNAL